MGAVRWCGFLLGLVTVLGTGYSLFTTLVVPRGVSSRLGGAVDRAVHGVAVALTTVGAGQRDARTHFETADRVLAVIGPLSLLALLATWQVAFIVGYALILLPFVPGSFAAALRESGSSLFTLGLTSTDTTGATVVDFLAAATGLASVALLIAYLPTLYSAFSKREKLVTMLEARAGQPAWGPEILARQALVGLMDTLPAFYDEWEDWAAELAESHANYPVLLRFRSPNAYRSWIIALIAVLDSAALYLAFNPSQAPRQARLCLRQGFSALRDIARAVRVPFDDDPSPADPVALTYDEFSRGVRRLRDTGFPMERTPEEAWPHFRGWRVNYEQVTTAIADLIDAPPAPWTGTRRHFPEVIVPRRPRDRRPEDPEGRTNPRLFPVPVAGDEDGETSAGSVGRP